VFIKFMIIDFETIGPFTNVYISYYTLLLPYIPLHYLKYTNVIDNLLNI
jgi:hypothetical protein